MATLPLFADGLPFKQTDDSDSSRLNDYPSIIRDNSGRLILFYEKEFASGLSTGGVVTFVDPSLDCHVDAGTGEINGTPVVWSADDLTLGSNTYTLVYVDNAGNVGHTADFPISFVKDVIALAFVNVGLTTIVRITMIEKRGTYIFSRRQVLSGSDYVWDDYESRLNPGIKPEAFFDSTNNKAYCTFIKDGSTFVRMFDTTSALTWEDKNNVEEVSSILYPTPQPENELLVQIGTDEGVYTSAQPSLYDLARNMPAGLARDSTVAYVHLPYISSSYISAAIPPYEMEVFTYDGTNYTLENTFTVLSAERNSLLETQWTGTTGLKYLGLRINHTLFAGDFVTDPADYTTARIPSNLDFTELSGSDLTTQIFPEIYPISPMATNDGTWTKDSEQGQLFKFVDDDQTNRSMAISNGTWTKDSEQGQLFKFVDDDQTNRSMATYSGVHTIINV